jgi:hypothetical protein
MAELKCPYCEAPMTERVRDACKGQTDVPMVGVESEDAPNVHTVDVDCENGHYYTYPCEGTAGRTSS